MAVELMVNQSFTLGGTAHAFTKKYTNSSQLIVDENIADGQTDKAVAMTLDVSAVQAIMIVSDQDVTFEINNATTPTPSIPLKANVPYIWTIDMVGYNVLLLTVDVTGAFVTNASGNTARVQVLAQFDATP